MYISKSYDNWQEANDFYRLLRKKLKDVNSEDDLIKRLEELDFSKV